MRYGEWITSLKVGDRVGYGRHSIHFGTVTKINGHGHITLDSGKVFNKFGDEYKNERWGDRLQPADQAEKALAKAKLDREVDSSVAAILAELQEHRNGYGKYCMSQQTKDKLTALVAALPINYIEG